MAEEAEEEHVCEECPTCPPVGAPAWMATFADMATLLMAFFVLILSFAEFNVPKFKQISGSLKNAFGVQRITPVVEQPMGTTVISMNFSPSPSPSVTDEMTQQTTELNQPRLETQNKTKDDDGSNEQSEDMVKALEEAIARGDVEIEMLGEKVVVNFTNSQAPEKDLPEMLQQTLDAIEQVKKAAGKSEQEVLFGGLEQQLAKFAEAMSQQQQEQVKGGAGVDGNQTSKGDRIEKAVIAEDELKVALKQEIGQGLVDVQRLEDRVIVTVGSGGAFRSGSATLTPQAIAIMDQIAQVNAKGSSRINVSGHTDDVPLVFGSQYRDNWDLAAARSASVVQALESTGKIKSGRMQAISFGESKPVADNKTPQGRSKNRRIEIEINY